MKHFRNVQKQYRPEQVYAADFIKKHYDRYAIMEFPVMFYDDINQREQHYIFDIWLQTHKIVVNIIGSAHDNKKKRMKDTRFNELCNAAGYKVLNIRAEWLLEQMKIGISLLATDFNENLKKLIYTDCKLILADGQI